MVGTGTTWKSGVYKPDKGHMFWGPDGLAYEVDYVESDTVLYLVTAYAGQSATGQAYSIVISITGQVPAFSRELSAFVAYHHGQMDGWQQLLTGTGDVTLTAPDGTKKTVPSWEKVMNAGNGVVAQATAQAGIATAEAAKAAASAGVAANIIAAAALPIPDLWAPLTDDLRLITGHGREVKVGDDVVAKVVNFSRATTATYTGKDGKLRVAAVNEPRFEMNGLLIEGVSTNHIFAHDVATAEVGCSKTGKMEDPLGVSDGAEVFTVSDIHPQGVYVRLGVPDTSAPSQVKTSSCYVRSVGKAGKFIITSEQANPAAFDVPADTWVRITTTRTSPEVPFSNFFDLIADASNGDRFAVWGGQLEDLPFMSSLILTHGASATRSADVCILPEINLMRGKSITVFCENDTFCNATGITYVLSSAAIGGAYWGLSRGNNPSGHLIIGGFYSEVFDFYNELSGKVVTQGGSFSSDKNEVAIVAGNKILKKEIVNKSEFNPAQMFIGNASNMAYPLWGHIKNIRVWNKQLSDEQLKAIA